MKNKMFWFFWPFLLLLKQITTSAIDNDHCKQEQLEDYTYGKMKEVGHPEYRLAFTATLQAVNLSLNQPICLSLEFDNNCGKPNCTSKKYQEKTQKYLNIHVLDSWQEYKIEKSYSFGFPNITGQCKISLNETCKEDSTVENCDKEELNGSSRDCIKMYSQHNCRDPLVNGSVCCSTSVFGKSTEKYKAIYMDLVTSFFYLKITLKDVQENILWSENVTLSTDNHKMNFSHGVLTVLQYPLLSRLPETWAYVSFQEPNQVRTGVLLNGVNETSISKVGWYKWPHTDQDEENYVDEIRSGFMIDSMDCGKNDIEWKLQGYGFQDHTDKGILLQDFYNSTIVSGKFIEDEMKVKVRTRDQFQLTMTVDLIIPVNYLVDVKQSCMERIMPTFEKRINDSYSIAVIIERGYGTLLIEVGNISSEEILIPNVNPNNYTYYVNVSDKVSEKMIVCVSTVGRPVIIQHCKHIHQMPYLVSPQKQRNINGNQTVLSSKVILISVTVGMLLVGLIVLLLSVRTIRNRLIGYTFVKNKKRFQFDHVTLVEETELAI